ncbi:MAG: T9SS type A sorting domain-containing protein, partial [Flavobacteriales bacterium]
MQCGQSVPNAVVSAIDNCTIDLIVALSANTVLNDCGYSLIRTWTVTDDCGNTTTASQTTTFIDTTDPVISNVPDNAIVACGSLPTPQDFDVVATDNCLQDIVLESNYSDQGTGCNMTRTITWTATDVCGNTTSVTRTFGITDETDPVLGGLPESATVACGNLPVAADFTVGATDNCDANVAIESSVDDQISGCNMVRTITWTATDDCGNSSSASRTFTSSDTTAPILVGVPQDAEMQCGQNVPNAVVSAIDNCDMEPVVSLTAETIQSDCGHTLVRTWTATDACGNVTTASQSTTFIDTTAPTLVNLPTNGTAGCASLPLDTNFDVTVTDNCDDEIQLTSEVSDSGEGCNLQRTITWTAVDACGNTTSASRVFSMVDTENPILHNIPNDGSVLCGGLPSSTEYNVSASDNCDTDVTIAVDAIDEGTGCNVTRTITWTATDDCGNTATATRTFTTQDNTPPVLIGVPQDVTLQCGQPVPDAVVVALDNCSTEPGLALSANTIQLECGYAFVRTWTAIDDCGNSVSATQTTTYVDNAAPILSGLPENGSFGCGQLPDEGTFLVTATDNCTGDVEINVTIDDSGTGCNVQRTITWTATDACGNTESESRNFSISDAVAPELMGLPENGTVACGNLPNATDFNVVASDNCANTLTVISSYDDNVNGCSTVRTITWSVTDACGNTTSESRQFMTMDNVAPIILDVPQDVTLQCGQSVPDAVITAIDNCDEDLSVILDATTVPNSCGYSFIRTWTVTDDCGNTTIATHTTNYVDNSAPQLVGVPENAVLSCAQLPLEDSFGVYATDNCDNDITVTVEVTDTGIGCQTVRQMEWTATDDCGNTTSEVRTFTSMDNIAPQFTSVPANQTLACINLTAPAELTATDNCDQNVEVVYSENISSGCPYVITRTWTATDNCGNSTSVSQAITVIDNFNPVLHNLPSDLTLNCGDLMPVNNVWATDNCDQSIEVVYQEQTETMECLSIVTRTWSATDLCGNYSSHTQTIYIVDESAPVFMSPPQNMTVSCENLTPAVELSVTDNCDNDVQITFSESIMTNGCPYMIKRIWTATDDCGNATTIAQIVTVFDNQPPVFAPFNSTAQLECGIQIPSTPIVTDNCGGAVNVTFTDITTSDECAGMVQRTYTATDACGNTATAVRTFNFVDTTPPALVNMPLDLFMQCGDVIPEPATVTATDNCTADATITFTQTQTSETCPYNIVRTWTATDNCGNTVTGQQLIHVIEPQPAAVYFNAYPNPGRTGKLKIQFSVPDQSVAEGALYDISGRLVAKLMEGKAQGGMVYEWDAQQLHLGPGTYIMTMTVNGEFYKKQFVILDEN